MEQGGYTANMNGRTLENMVENLLKTKGYYELTAEEKKTLIKHDGEPPVPNEKWYSKQVRLERNLYGAKYTMDFYVFDADLFPDGLQIETKWQSSSGSVDEKYCFTVLSLQKMSGTKILILDGGGARQGAIQWIKRQAEKKGFKYFTLTGFITWANKTLKNKAT
jgi:hypothetical protein